MKKLALSLAVLFSVALVSCGNTEKAVDTAAPAVDTAAPAAEEAPAA